MKTFILILGVLLLIAQSGRSFTTTTSLINTRQSATPHHQYGPLLLPPSLSAISALETAVDTSSSSFHKDNNADDDGADYYHDTDNDDDTVSSETHRINLELAKLAVACADNTRQSQRLALAAFDLLKHNMTHPDTVAYNSVLKAFAKSAPSKFPPPASSRSSKWVSAAERAHHLLEEMMAVHKAQTAAYQDWYIRRDKQQTMSQAELQQGPPKIRVKPNVRSFSTVMDAYSRTGQVPETLQVLQELQDRYDETGDFALQPNIVSYNTVLAAYAKSRGGLPAAEQAEQFLEEQVVQPDVVSYNALLVCWARSGVPHAGERAEAILRQMPVTPNTKSYATAMDALARCARSDSLSAARAHGLLKELQEAFEETGDEALRPNCISYSSVIHAYAVSKEPQKAQRAFALLEEMKQKGQTDPAVRPNTVTYNSVLNACTTSSPLGDHHYDGGTNPKSLQSIVQSLYQELIQSDDPRLKPDHFTFGTVLKACANNIFWDDPTFGMYVFQEARRRGQVSLGVLVQLRHAVPMHVLCEFMPSQAYDRETRQFTMSHIPKAWTRNVRERKK
ncbi:Pentatricopeptide repeat-containing protein [Seminavis robusta]|uniref:Pentatricopeptide repeat-containing protein n=1 Tax=Seminavis robusta TaxID=568900 RepID=A0A9N8EJ08_9STRA|nr:Pentatricopeptide repeat-containing protein [Seminavis robusta]|eukprot:Sro1064_g237260.1 Pentatricopeptide repeat-containing protein (563) ;mRNA; r:23271-24959